MKFFFFSRPPQGRELRNEEITTLYLRNNRQSETGGEGGPPCSGSIGAIWISEFHCPIFFFSFRKNLQLIIFHIFLYNKLANQISAFLEHPNIYIYIYINVPNFIIEILKNVPNFSL